MKKLTTCSRWVRGVMAALALTLGACAMGDDGIEVSEDEMLIPSDGSAPTNAAGVTATQVVANAYSRCPGGAADVGKTCRLASSEYTLFDNSRHCLDATQRYACN